VATISLRPLKDGSVRYQVKVRVQGRPPQAATFARRRDAERWAKETEVELRTKRPPEVAAERRTVGEMIDRYLKEVLPQKRGSAKQRAQFLWWREKIGLLPLSAVTPRLLAEWRDRLAAGGTPSRKPAAPATQVRYLAALSHCLNVAVRDWEWLETNPARNVRRPSEPRGRVRFLSEAEITALLDACRESGNRLLYPLVVAALGTGARKGELLSLRWSDLDLARGVARLEHTKNGERRTLPLSPPVLAALRDLAPGRKAVFVFVEHGTSGAFRNAFACALRRAGITNFRFHDLRHTAASYLAMNGATLTDIAGVLGHKTLAMVKRYAHLSDHHLAQVVARMNAAIFPESDASPDTERDTDKVCMGAHPATSVSAIA